VADVFDLSPDKILVLGILALVVLGPKRLPEAARSAGRFLSQLRHMSASFQSEMRDAMGDPTQGFSSVITELRPAEVRRSVRQAINPIANPEPRITPPTWAPVEPGQPWMPGLPDDPSLN
jgi:sec-independent protein translocase protein TatB